MGRSLPNTVILKKASPASTPTIPKAGSLGHQGEVAHATVGDGVAGPRLLGQDAGGWNSSTGSSPISPTTAMSTRSPLRLGLPSRSGWYTRSGVSGSSRTSTPSAARASATAFATAAIAPIVPPSAMPLNPLTLTPGGPAGPGRHAARARCRPESDVGRASVILPP